MKLYDGGAPGESRFMHLTNRGHHLRGVVYVGANIGQEMRWFIANHLTPILAFEPHPQAFAGLEREFGRRPEVRCVHAALGEEDGEMDLLVPADGNSEHASKYQPVPLAGHDWTSVPNTHHLTVPVRRFENWVEEEEVDLLPYNALSVDAQGMELEVLRGMGYTINAFDYLCIECSSRPVYTGEASAETVSEWLWQQGFDRRTDIEEHQDILFVRRPYIPATLEAELAARFTYPG